MFQQPDCSRLVVFILFSIFSLTICTSSFLLLPCVQSRSSCNVEHVLAEKNNSQYFMLRARGSTCGTCHNVLFVMLLEIELLVDRFNFLILTIHRQASKRHENLANFYPVVFLLLLAKSVDLSWSNLNMIDLDERLDDEKPRNQPTRNSFLALFILVTVLFTFLTCGTTAQQQTLEKMCAAIF